MAKIFNIPDIGDTEATVIEILVKEGEEVKAQQPILTLESDKASMDVVSPSDGKVKKILLNVNDKALSDVPFLALEDYKDDEVSSDESTKQQNKTKSNDDTSKTSKVSNSKSQVIEIPEGVDSATVIEIFVKKGDVIAQGQAILTLESDKASMDFPSPVNGIVDEILLKVNDQVKTGDKAISISPESVSFAGYEDRFVDISEPVKYSNPSIDNTVDIANDATAINSTVDSETQVTDIYKSKIIHAGPATRHLARELGVDLTLIPRPTGPLSRITKIDLYEYVKNRVKTSSDNTYVASSNVIATSVPEVTLPDFSKYGKINRVSMSKMDILTAEAMYRSHMNVPPVTQFEDANIKELEGFRVSLKSTAESKSIKLTLLSFIVKACAVILKENPKLNSSLDLVSKERVYKEYYNIGFAVDTKHGLLVPVIKDVLNKSIWDIASDIISLSKKSVQASLSISEMQGSCFTISSLGGIGGTYFTPIVNTPEAAILGLGKSRIMPSYNPKTDSFEKSLSLPLSLSYDHRIINGADAARYITRLKHILEDIRHLSLVL